MCSASKKSESRSLGKRARLSFKEKPLIEKDESKIIAMHAGIVNRTENFTKFGKSDTDWLTDEIRDKKQSFDIKKVAFSEDFPLLENGITKFKWMCQEIKDNFEYDKIEPEFVSEKIKMQKVDYEKLSKNAIHLPSRLSFPLMNLPSDCKDFIEEGTFPAASYYRPTTLASLHEILITCMKELDVPGNPEIVYTIPDLLNLANAVRVPQDKMRNYKMEKIAKTFLKYDMSEGLNGLWNASLVDIQEDPKWNFINICHMLRLKTVIYQARDTAFITKEDAQLSDTHLVINDASCLVMASHQKNPNWIISMHGSMFLFYVKNQDKVFIGDTNYLDYAYTYCNIMINVPHVQLDNDKMFAIPITKIFNRLLLSDVNHNTKVDFAKSFETYCLNLTDIQEDDEALWNSYIDGISGMYDCHTKYHDLTDTDHAYIASYGDEVTSYKATCPICQLCDHVNKMKPQERFETSTLHKFLFYAEVDETKGLLKEYERIATKRPSDPTTIKDLTRIFKRNFIYGFAKKHKKLPVIKHGGRLTTLLNNMVTGNKIDEIKKIPLTQFDVVEFGETKELIHANAGLPFAKNKKAIKRKKKLSTQDSQEEIAQFLEKENVEVTLKDYSKFKEPKNIKARIVSPYDEEKTDEYILNDLEFTDSLFNNLFRLIAKEREQKISPRFFGNQPIEEKYELAFLNENAKRIVPYFYGELITKGDKQRVKIISELRDKLVHEDYYCLMLDIEGHNKSMQAHNTDFIFQQMGDLLGNEMIKTYGNYFHSKSNYYDFKNVILASVLSGQYGGVEGWMNPIWTLHNTLLMSLFSFYHLNDIETFMIYSDDNCLIFHKDILEKYKLSELMNLLIAHYKGGGCVIKFSQTTISHKRMTILRNHSYINNVADSYLKRFLSIMIFNRSDIHDDNLETSALLSSVSSTLENSNSQIGATYLKWYYCLFLNYKPYIDAMNKKYNRGNEKFFKLMMTDSEIASMNMDQELLTALKNGRDNPDSFLNYIASFCGQLGDEELSTRIKDVLAKDPTLRDIRGTNRMQKLHRFFILSKNENIQSIFFLRMVLPERLGGFNVEFLSQQLLSGHSIGFIKQMSRIFNLKNLHPDKWVIWSQIIDELGYGHTSGSHKPTDSSILLYQYPTVRSFPLMSGYLEKMCFSRLKKQNNNKTIAQYLRMDEAAPDLASRVGKLFQEKFEFRVANFYYEHSSRYLRSYLIAKFEDTSALMGRGRGLKQARTSLMKQSEAIRYDFINLIVEGMEFHERFAISNTINSCEYFLKLRENKFGRIVRGEDWVNVNYLNQIEPEYDNLIEETSASDGHVFVGISKLFTGNTNVLPYGYPLYSDEVKFKGFIDEYSLEFHNLETFISHKVLCNTEFILQTSEKYRDPDVIIDPTTNNVIKAANLSMSTYSSDRYEDFQSEYRKIIGGEVLHRLQNTYFKINSYLRALPNDHRKIRSFIVGSNIRAQNLEDFNDNYDLIRIKLHLMRTLQMKYLHSDYPLSYFKVRHSTVRKNVQIDYCYNTKETKKTIYQYKYPKHYDKKLIEISNFIVYEQTLHPLSYYSGSNVHMRENAEYIYRSNPDIYDIVLHELRRLYRKNLMPALKYIEIGLLVDLIYTLSKRYDRQLMTLMDKKQIDEYSLYNKLIERNKEMNKVTSPEQLHKDIAAIINSFLEAQNITFIGRRDMDYKKEYEFMLDKLKAKNIKHSSTEETKEDIRKFRKSEYTISRVTYFLAKYFNLFNLSDGIFHFETNYLQEYLITIIKSDTLKLIMTDHDYKEFLSIGEYHFMGCFVMSEDTIYNSLTELALDLTDYLINVNMVSELKYQLTDLHNTDISSMITLPFKYLKMIPPDKLFNNIEWRNDVFKNLKDQVELYMDPAVLNSPTGSDALVPQFFLFRELIQSGMLNEKSFVLDLFSGRGDGHLALKHLKIPHLSMSQTDSFTDLCNNSELENIKNYNFEKTETWDLGLNVTHHHLDISYYKGDTQKFELALNTLLNYDTSISIRINHLNIDLTKFLGKMNEDYRDYHLYISFLKPYVHYNIYLVIGRPGEMNDFTRKCKTVTEFSSAINNIYFTTVSKDMQLLSSKKSLITSKNWNIDLVRNMDVRLKTRSPLKVCSFYSTHEKMLELILNSTIKLVDINQFLHRHRQWLSEKEMDDITRKIRVLKQIPENWAEVEDDDSELYENTIKFGRFRDIIKEIALMVLDDITWLLPKFLQRDYLYLTKIYPEGYENVIKHDEQMKKLDEKEGNPMRIHQEHILNDTLNFLVIAKYNLRYDVVYDYLKSMIAYDNSSRSYWKKVFIQFRHSWEDYLRLPDRCTVSSDQTERLTQTISFMYAYLSELKTDVESRKTQIRMEYKKGLTKKILKQLANGNDARGFMTMAQSIEKSHTFFATTNGTILALGEDLFHTSYTVNEDVPPDENHMDIISTIFHLPNTSDSYDSEYLKEVLAIQEEIRDDPEAWAELYGEYDPDN